MKADFPVMEADATHDEAHTWAQGPRARVMSASHAAAEPAQVHEWSEHQTASMSLAFVALVPATLMGVMAFVGGLVVGQGLGYSLLAYTLVGCVTYAILIALALLRGNASDGQIATAQEQAYPATRHPLPIDRAAAMSARQRIPAEWQDECVARPAGSIHDRR